MISRARAARSMRILALMITVIGSLVPAGLAVGQENVSRPIVVAVDTSRSLTPSQLAAAIVDIKKTLDVLPAGTPSGLVAFDDEPKWIVEVGAPVESVSRALASLEPRGLYTLLNDAIFATTRELVDGGVILLVSDGRDENSATTIDDIARRCEAQRIRIVAVGTGRRIAERALRRLALVSDGAYLGEFDQTAPIKLAERLSAELVELSIPSAEPAQQVVVSPPVQARTPVPESPPAPASPSPSAERPAAEKANTPWLMILLGTGMVAVIVGLLVRGKRAANQSFCSVCGSELDIAGDCSHCDEAELQQRLQPRMVASLGESAEVSVDTAVFEQMSLEERLDKTRVLAYESVLNVLRPGEPPRSYLISRDKAFGVGRIEADNTLALPDPALSSHHFKIVPEGEFDYVVDMGSTNGSFVNGQRTGARKLVSGDVITAGQVDFEYKNHTTAT